MSKKQGWIRETRTDFEEVRGWSAMATLRARLSQWSRVWQNRLRMIHGRVSLPARMQLIFLTTSRICQA